MTPYLFSLMLLVGIIIGTFSGLIGIGGGVLLIPALVYFFGMSQHQAQGTSLALLLPPIGLLAVIKYYQQGYVDFKVAAIIAVGFFVGGFLGAKLAVGIPDLVLRRIFALMMILIGVRMFFK